MDIFHAMKSGVWDWEGKHRGHSDTLATDVFEIDFMTSTALYPLHWPYDLMHYPGTYREYTL